MDDGECAAGTTAVSTGKLILFSTEVEFAEDKFSADFEIVCESVERDSRLSSLTNETVTKFSGRLRLLPNTPESLTTKLAMSARCVTPTIIQMKRWRVDMLKG